MFGGVGKSGSPISRWTMLRPWASSLRALASTSKAVSVPTSSISLENFMTASSSHAERAEVPPNGHPANAHVLDPRHSWPLAKHIEEPLQRVSAALRLHLHGAIVAVADVALEAEPAGARLGKIAESNPLDVAEDLRLEAAPFLLRRL